MLVKLGVTGTRDGMTPHQWETIIRILTNCPTVGELCGARDKSRDGGWIKTLCNTHAMESKTKE